MSKNFSAQIDDFVLKTEKRMLALVRQSTQEVIDVAQTPVAKGGRMRVDTGFLRASGQISLNGMPSGPVRGDPDQSYDFDDGVTVLQLAKVELGNSIFFGWTANYAKYREAYDGFLSTAVQQWPDIVKRVAAEIKRRIQ